MAAPLPRCQSSHLWLTCPPGADLPTGLSFLDLRNNSCCSDHTLTKQVCEALPDLRTLNGQNLDEESELDDDAPSIPGGGGHNAHASLGEDDLDSPGADGGLAAGSREIIQRSRKRVEQVRVRLKKFRSTEEPSFALFQGSDLNRVVLETKSKRLLHGFPVSSFVGLFVGLFSHVELCVIPGTATSDRAACLQDRADSLDTISELRHLQANTAVRLKELQLQSGEHSGKQNPSSSSEHS